MNEMVDRVLQRTKLSFSRRRYGEQAWRNAIKHLLTFQYSEDDVVLILNSKLMRVSADLYAEQQDEICMINGAEIIQYKREQTIDIEALREGYY